MKQLFTLTRNLIMSGVLFTMFVSAYANADTLWTDHSVTLLKGSNYEVGSSQDF